MQITKLNIILSLVCNSHWLWKKPGSSTPVTVQVLLMLGSKCLAGNQSGHDIILLKTFCPLFRQKKSIKNYLIRVCYIRKLVSSHQKFDLILEMYRILPWKCWCICLLAGHDMGDPFEVSTLRREVIIYYLTIMYMLITCHIFFLLQETIILNMVNFYLSYPLLWQTSHLKY